MEIECTKCKKTTSNKTWEFVEDNPTGSGENLYRCPKCKKVVSMEPAGDS